MRIFCKKAVKSPQRLGAPPPRTPVGLRRLRTPVGPPEDLRTPALLLPLTDVQYRFVQVRFWRQNYFITLKNNTEITNSKCYLFASSEFFRLFFTSNSKKDDKYLAPPEIPPRVGLATALPKT